MPAANFAALTKAAPNPSTTNHPNGGAVGYTCHMAAMHWAFKDLGDNDAIANAKVEAINTNKCPGCTAAAPAHISILHAWYGLNCCAAAALIANRAALYAAVNVGDVLIVGAAAAPSHTMVVVQKKSILGLRYVYVRGFNNFGTLGTGIYLQYDNADRDIDKARYWHTPAGVAPPNDEFGQSAVTGGALHVIPYANYSANATVVRNNCQPGPAATWTYVGP